MLQVAIVGADGATFKPIPSEIVFQNYDSQKTYTVPLMFQNLGLVSIISKKIWQTDFGILLKFVNHCCYI
jgi:CTP synthase (UTP-ammonia lyase)